MVSEDRVLDMNLKDFRRLPEQNIEPGPDKKTAARSKSNYIFIHPYAPAQDTLYYLMKRVRRESHLVVDSLEDLMSNPPLFRLLTSYTNFSAIRPSTDGKILQTVDFKRRNKFPKSKKDGNQP